MGSAWRNIAKRTMIAVMTDFVALMEELSQDSQFALGMEVEDACPGLEKAHHAVSMLIARMV